MVGVDRQDVDNNGRKCGEARSAEGVQRTDAVQGVCGEFAEKAVGATLVEAKGSAGLWLNLERT